jgi:hypothetical protein
MGIGDWVLTATPPRGCVKLLLSFHLAVSANVVRFPVCSFPASPRAPRDIFLARLIPPAPSVHNPPASRPSRSGAAGKSLVWPQSASTLYHSPSSSTYR